MHDTSSPSLHSANAIAVATLLESWTQERRTGLMPHRDVIDRLLDLRNLLPEERRLVVDNILVDIPGRSVVDASWWFARVADLRLLIVDMSAAEPRPS